MNKIDRKNLMLTILGVVTLLTFVIGAAFAYFQTSANLDDNVVVNAQLNPNNSSFTVESAELAINVAPSLMIETQASTTAKATNTANLVVTYNSGGPELTCTYDIVFYWDSQYTKSTNLPLTTDKGTWNYEMSLKSTAVAADSSSASSLTETNMDWTNGTVLHSGETIYSNGNNAVNSYSYTLSFYNLDTDQSSLIKNNEATSYGSHLAVENINCTAGKPQVTLATHIKSLAADRDTTKTWQVINENGYRYEGTSEATENWICLDSTCAVPYRIIGVFEETYTDSNNEVKTGELVKVVRAEQQSATQFWNTTKTGTNYNDWSTATLKTALNATTGSAEQNVYATLSSDAKDIVVKGRWHLGNVVWDNVTASQAYAQERNTATSNLYNGNQPYVDEYVGLIYPSDYGYAVKEAECRDVVMYNYKDAGTPVCKNNNWLFSGSTYWTISPSSYYSDDAMRVDAAGCVYGSYSVSNGRFGARESLYLAPETKFSGSGKSNDKFYAFS